MLAKAIYKVLFILFFVASAQSQVIELGESELLGKKERPEVMMLISRARSYDSELMIELSASQKIKAAIDDRAFIAISRE